ncbi:MAG TPA: sugar ABC transporter substrate-binding protein [Gaiellaceae bacterium]|nr:sugar ABC transporter substrate-binding protein [Gaiellaceae bacterium]
MRRALAIAAVLLVAAVATTATLASSASGSRKKTINIAVFLASAANTYWEAELLGAKDVAKKYPNVKLTTFDAQFTTNKQVSQLRDALVSNRYQAWFVGPNDGGPLTPTIRQAIAKGVKVGCALVPCGPNVRETKVQIPGQVIFTGVGFFQNGQLLGKLVVQGCKGIDPCKVLWLPGLPTLPLEVARQDGLYSVIKPYKNIKVVAVAAGGYLAAPALKATQNVLQAHPDLNVVVSSGDQMIAGAAKAAQLVGKAGKIKMYGNGCTFEAKQLILKGVQTGCAVYLPRTEGRLVVQALVNAVNGAKKTGVFVNPLKYSPIGGLGTKANIAKFTPEFHS